MKHYLDHDLPQRSYLLTLSRIIAALTVGGALALAAGLWLPKALTDQQLKITNTSSTHPLDIMRNAPKTGRLHPLWSAVGAAGLTALIAIDSARAGHQ